MFLLYIIAGIFCFVFKLCVDGLYYPWFSLQNSIFLRLIFSIYQEMLVLIKLRTTNTTGRPVRDFPFASQSTIDTLTTPYTTSFPFSRIQPLFTGTLLVQMIIKKTCMVLKN